MSIILLERSNLWHIIPIIFSLQKKLHYSMLHKYPCNL